MLMRPPVVQCPSRSSVGATGCRAVAFRTHDAHGLYGQLGFLPADETVMQRPRPTDS
jgi:hypothetical protein